MKRARVLAPCQDKAHSKRRCRTLEEPSLDRSGRFSVRWSQGSLEVKPTTLATEERLERNHARLSVWEKDVHRLQAQDAVSNATTENETETAPRRQRTLSNKAAHHQELLAARMSSEAAANAMNLLQLGAVGPQTRQKYAASLVTDAEIDAAMSTWVEAEFVLGNPASSGERLLSTWMDKFTAFGKRGARRLPNTWRSLQGWQRLSPCRSRKPWVRAVWSGTACRLAEQGQPAMGLLVMTGILPRARPGSSCA